MKAVARFTTLSVILGALLIAMPQDSFAGKGNKGGKSGEKKGPNENSIATTAACIQSDGSARVYSCKGISNVVIWCSGTYIKFDNVSSDDGEVYEDVFSCGDAGGSIDWVAVKSGSQMHKKHHGDYDGSDVPAGAPSGSGLFDGDIPYCYDLAPADIPTPGDCSGGSDDSGDNGDTGNSVDTGSDVDTGGNTGDTGGDTGGSGDSGGNTGDTGDSGGDTGGSDNTGVPIDEQDQPTYSGY